MKRFLRLFMLLIFTINMIFPSAAFSEEMPFSQANSISELQNIIFNAIQNRQTEFRVRYFGNTDNITNDVKNARDAAISQDPYEEGCISLISGFKLSKYTDHADITFDSFNYYTTAEQEKFVDTTLQQIFSQIITQNMSQAQRVKAIHDYIATHIKYDSSLANYTAYNALHDGSTVCNGFVQLGYRLLKMAGIEAMAVKGTLNSSNQDHLWNLVKINNQWYHIDLTLDTSLSTGNSISYKYYNLNDSAIKATHSFDQSAYPASTAQYQYAPISIGSFPDISVTQGQRPVLPYKALVTYEDNSVSEETVTWENFDYTIPGDKIVKGSVSVRGYILNTSIRVIINANTSASTLTPVSIPSDVKEFNKFINMPVPRNKSWVLEFNAPLDLSTITPENILVIDSQNVKVSGVTIRKGSKDTQIVVDAPQEGYANGKTYYIYILKGLKSSSQKNTVKPIRIPFVIVNQ